MSDEAVNQALDRFISAGNLAGARVVIQACIREEQIKGDSQSVARQAVLTVASGLLDQEIKVLVELGIHEWTLAHREIG